MATERRPNIVYILADDLGYGDVSCLNPESRIQTPQMDRVAAEGLTFTDAHSNSAVCTPTRYGVLTGRYAWRGRLKSGVLHGYSEPLIEPDRMTVPSLLQANGYATACIGKWHLGLGWPKSGAAKEAVDFSQPLTAGPQTVGFDHSLIIPASLDMAPYCYIEDGRVVETASGATADSPRPAYWRGGACAPGFQHETVLLELTCRAEEFINRQARLQPERPFFLYFPTTSPHTPHVPREPFRGMSQCGVYGDFVVEHDWTVGRILAALERNGLADNTLVVVTSDNGAHCRGGGFDFEREFGHRSSHIYRGQKSDAWDGGHRIPFLVRWPGQVAPGTTCDQTICLTDLLATAADLLGAELPADAGEDSSSFLPLLAGNTAEPVRGPVIHHSIKGDFAIRQGPWKLIESRGSGGWSLPDREVPADAPAAQLYNLTDDPGEEHNRIDREPEIAARLAEYLRQAREADRSVSR